MLQDVAAPIEHQEALIAPTHVYTRLKVRIATQVSHNNGVRVVLKLAVPAPNLAASVIPHRITDQDFIAAVTVGIESIREMPCKTPPLPQKLKPIIKDPKTRIDVLNKNFMPTLVARKIEKGEGIAIFKLIWPKRLAMKSRWHPDPVPYFSCTTLQDLKLKVPHENDFIAPVAVNIVNLKRRVIGHESVSWVGAS
jgi:hypothetical protein